MDPQPSPQAPPPAPAPKLTRRGRQVARALASEVIRLEPSRWRDLKEMLVAGYDLSGSGYVQVEFSGPACKAALGLPAEERATFEEETQRQFNKIALHLLVNAICGEIYARARRAAARANR